MKRLIVSILAVAAACLAVSCEFGQNDTHAVETDTVSVVASDTLGAEADSLVQCKGVTKKGTQCERMLWWPDTLCFQHKGQALPNEN